MTDIEKILEIENIFLSKAVFELHDAENALKGGILEFSSSAQLYENSDNKFLQVEFELITDGTREEIAMFHAACAFTCLMKIKSTKRYEKLSDEEKTNFAVKHVYQLVRQFITNLLVQAGLGGIQLPVTPEKFMSIEEAKAD
jgi:hypothetical protein